MRLNGVDIPDVLLDAIRSEDLVIFAGAGISAGSPALLPLFDELADEIGLDVEQRVSQEPPDRYLGRLQARNVLVHDRAAEILAREGVLHTELHVHLLRMFPAADRIRLVTTNFDNLFEQAASSIGFTNHNIFVAPALPLGHDFLGLVHVHGSVRSPSRMILTDRDFGAAYLTDGWARRFMLRLFQRYTVLFVGYAHEDLVLSYLARALPVAIKPNRFALVKGTPSEPLDRWRLLGIEPLLFPEGGDDGFTVLREVVRGLSEIAQRTPSDWQRAITIDAAESPPEDIEVSSRLERAFVDVSTLRYFVAAATQPGWLLWLDDRKLLDNLFLLSTDLSERDRVLAHWIATTLAVQHPDPTLLLLGKHGLKINPLFWWALARELGLGQTVISLSTFSRWTSILLATRPADIDFHCLHFIAEKAYRLGATTSLLAVFAAMSEEKLTIKQGFDWSSSDGQRVPSGIEATLTFRSEHHPLLEVYANHIKPQLAQVAGPMLSITTEAFERRNSQLTIWGQTNDGWDSDGSRRSAVEAHEQDQYPETIDVLVDCARDALEILERSDFSAFMGWRAKLYSSSAVLNRRLAVHATCVSTALSGDDKLLWLVEKVGVFNDQLHHELYRLLSVAYPVATGDRRRDLIERISRFKWPEPQHEEADSRSLRVQFDLLSWLCQADSTCDLARAALLELSARHQDLRQRDHPDFTHWIGEATWVGSRSPLTSEQIRSEPIDRLLPFLLSFQDGGFDQPDRRGLMDAVVQAAKESTEWSLELSDVLISTGTWDPDLWEALIRAWSEWPPNESIRVSIVQRLGVNNIHSAQARALAECLLRLVKHDTMPDENLEHATQPIAQSVWARIEETEEETQELQDWLGAAINHPAGKIAEYWVHSLSNALKRQRERSNYSVGPEFEQALTTMCSSTSQNGGMARSVIGSQLAFLLRWNERWVRQSLLPEYSADDAARAMQVWDGFLTWGRLNTETAALLEPAFLRTTARLNLLTTEVRRRFVQFYAACVFLVPDAQRPLWIRTLLTVAEPDDRRAFADAMGSQMRHLSDAEQSSVMNAWLGRYWRDRIRGIPVALDSGEIREMLEWPLRLPSEFSAATALALQMPRCNIEHSMLMHELKDTPHLVTYPVEAAQLVLRLLECDGPVWSIHGVQDVLHRLQQSLPDNIYTQPIIEKMLERGIPQA